MLRRNPIFSPEVGITPEGALHVDTLHTLHLGVFALYVHTVIWAAIETNFWHIQGPTSTVVEQGCRRLLNDYKTWCEEEKIDLNYQLQMLTPGMIGSSEKFALKTKAAETAVLLRWATAFSTTYSNRLTKGDVLSAAGQSLERYMKILREAPVQVPRNQRQELLDLCVRHLVLMGLADVKYIPKSNLFVILTLRIARCGNPRSYSTFMDESLNLVIAAVASAAHQATWEKSIFDRIRLMPYVSRNSAFAIV